MLEDNFLIQYKINKFLWVKQIVKMKYVFLKYLIYPLSAVTCVNSL